MSVRRVEQPTLGLDPPAEWTPEQIRAAGMRGWTYVGGTFDAKRGTWSRGVWRHDLRPFASFAISKDAEPRSLTDGGWVGYHLPSATPQKTATPLFTRRDEIG